MVVDLLGVSFRDLERLGGKIGNVAIHEELGVEVSRINLLRQVCDEELSALARWVEEKETYTFGKA